MILRVKIDVSYPLPKYGS